MIWGIAEVRLAGSGIRLQWHGCGTGPGPGARPGLERRRRLMNRVSMVAVVALVAALMAAPASAAPTKWVRGPVTAMTANTITVTVKGAESTFKVETTTQLIARGAGTASREKVGLKLASFVKVGSYIEVRYTEAGGAKVATEIRPLASRRGRRVQGEGSNGRGQYQRARRRRIGRHGLGRDQGGRRRRQVRRDAEDQRAGDRHRHEGAGTAGGRQADPDHRVHRAEGPGGGTTRTGPRRRPSRSGWSGSSSK